MDLVTLVVAFAAFGMSIFATWAALRQADAAERAVDKAAEANKTADEALRVAKAATELEHDRRHTEMQPRFSMAATGGATEVQAVTFTNGGPVQYDRIVMEAGEEASWAIFGFLGTGTTMRSSSSRSSCQRAWWSAERLKSCWRGSPWRRGASSRCG